jgi:hypothetical protein
LQVGTVGEGFGIRSLFRQRGGAASSFRDHDVLSFVSIASGGGRNQERPSRGRRVRGCTFLRVIQAQLDLKIA